MKSIIQFNNNFKKKRSRIKLNYFTKLENLLQKH
jgi:hypothetical protein